MRKHPSEHSEAECNGASSIFNCQCTHMRQYVCPYVCIYPSMEIYIYADISRNLYFHFQMKMKNLDLGS